MSWVPNDPRNPFLSGAGLGVLRGQRALALGGRLTSLFPTPKQTHVEMKVEVQPRHASTVGPSANVVSFVNGDYRNNGGSGTYVGTATAPGQGVAMDIIPLPDFVSWRSFESVLTGIRTPSLQLDWTGDLETERYSVYYATQASKSDAKRRAVYSRNDWIETTNLTNSETISVRGQLGVLSGGTQLLVNVFEDSGAFVIDVYDEIASTLIFQDLDYELGEWVSFLPGLSVLVPDTWSETGLTQFRILVTPQRRFTLYNPNDGANYFRVDSFKRGNGPTIQSDWIGKDVNMPPNPVENLAISFVEAGTIEVSFDLPSDANIAGARIYHSYPENGDTIPGFVPQYEIAGTSGQSKTQQISGLTAGVYGILVRAFDDEGIDDHSDDIRKVNLSASGASLVSPSVPQSIKATASDLSEVTIVVETDGSEDTIILFMDDDYDTDWQTLTKASDRNATTGAYTYVATSVTAGLRKFMVRSSLNGFRELNTTVYDEVTVYDTALDKPVLSVQEVF